MINYAIEFALTTWAALAVRLINRQTPYCLYVGIACNLSFITWWILTAQYGFLVGDLIFTCMYSREIYIKWN